MIRFAERQVKKILEGVKKVTRIDVPSPWKVGEEITAVREEDGIDRPFALLKVTGVREHELGSMTEEDAAAEGYSSLDEFVEVWREIHGGYDPSAKVWAISFELVRPISEDELASAGGV